MAFLTALPMKKNEVFNLSTLVSALRHVRSGCARGLVQTLLLEREQFLVIRSD